MNEKPTTTIDQHELSNFRVFVSSLYQIIYKKQPFEHLPTMPLLQYGIIILV